MTDNYRDRPNFRPQDDGRHDDPAQRWHPSEERYRREASSASDSRFDEDRGEGHRYEQNRGSRGSDYSRTARDDTYGSSTGRNEGRGNRYTQRDYYAARDYGSGGDGQPIHWHEHDREQRAGHPYRGTYGGNGDSSYFTGTQGSWAVGDPRVQRSGYGGQHFGADYRSHGYARTDDDRRGFWDRASDEVASWFGDEDAARRRDQDHRGHGPKDYTRSDERIREDANDRLTEDWRVDASNVTVTVASGEITLSGTVASREAKRRAEDVVDAVSGVKHVQNNLRVQTVAGGASATGQPGSWAASNPSGEGGTLARAPADAAKRATKV